VTKWSTIVWANHASRSVAKIQKTTIGLSETSWMRLHRPPPQTGWNRRSVSGLVGVARDRFAVVDQRITDGIVCTHTAPHSATQSHTEPHRATQSHTEPHRATEPHGAVWLHGSSWDTCSTYVISTSSGRPG